MSMNAPERGEERINPGIGERRVLQGREGTFALLGTATRIDGWIAQVMCDGVWEGGMRSLLTIRVRVMMQQVQQESVGRYYCGARLERQAGTLIILSSNNNQDHDRF